ncbi:ABC transporter A family member 4 [Fusarium mundagurra]|uniref:ABC transporter A family member 4 n=1 Tax=Fusarium mundagurra TaxID=1567541 RepID=A0A8H6DPJ0_9HYPO|nr:ABC transporter A family member 4 [Fusarium mundagurra]
MNIFILHTSPNHVLIHKTMVPATASPDKENIPDCTRQALALDTPPSSPHPRPDSRSSPSNLELHRRWKQGSNAGSDVGAVITKVKDGLKGSVEVADSEADLRKRCPTSLSGVRNCYAAVIFNDSPLSKTGNKTWSYTIRVSSARSSTKFDITTPSKNHYAPLQLAVENAITNSTTTPNNYMFTRITQDEAAEIRRRNFAATTVGGFGIREAGVAQLIDVMTGGAASARVLSYLVAFNIIYLPSWIIFGALYASVLVPTSNAGIVILWQILSGLSLTSMSVFAATTNIRYTAISMVIILMLLVTLCGILDSKPENVPALIVLVLSAIFQSSSYIFFLNQLCRNEAQGLATNISKPAPHQPRIYEVTVSMLWGLLLLTIIFYPLPATLIEKCSHGVSNKGRKFASANTTDSSTALKIVDLTKTYKPSLWRRLSESSSHNSCQLTQLFHAEKAGLVSSWHQWLWQDNNTRSNRWYTKAHKWLDKCQCPSFELRYVYHYHLGLQLTLKASAPNATSTGPSFQSSNTVDFGPLELLQR